jgi:outer membrane protein TolC
MLRKLGVVLAATCVAAAAQTSQSAAQSTVAGGGTVALSVNANQTSQSPFFGGTPSGTVTPGVIDLSLSDALDRGLKYNLGLLLTARANDQVRAAQLRTLSDLLPNINAYVAEVNQQINLAALGVPPSFLRGMSPIIGPFAIFDARFTYAQNISLKSIRSLRAAEQNYRASQASLRDSRDLVVLFVGGGYIQALSAQSRIEAIQAQLATAESLYRQAVDLKAAGTVPAIDVLRAQVEMQVQQQRLVAAQNDFDKIKLQLARAIGMPQAQQYRLTTEAPYQPAPPLTVDEALDRAFRDRADYQSAVAQVRAAEDLRSAAAAERVPGIQLTGNYGTLGFRPTSSHGTFVAAAELQIPIFQGGRIRSDKQTADAFLLQRQEQAADTRARVEFDVRSAFLDLVSASKQVEVARSSVGLATEQLQQAQDRFGAGVTNNIEVIQAQESVAVANENYIASLLAHNLAKLSLARSLGVAESAVKNFLGGSR